MRLRVDRRTGEVVLTIPRRASKRKALAWADGHRDWIEARLAEVAPALPIGPGPQVPLYDRPHRTDRSPERARTPGLRKTPGRRRSGEGLEARLLR